jgi:hypothetical protein
VQLFTRKNSYGLCRNFVLYPVLFEVMVTDSTACTLSAWIPHAMDIHKALHSSPLGSNKKDVPARMLKSLF